jgi:hypothetical protein
MSSAFEVVPEELVAHASHLDGLVDRLSTCADAARTVSMSDSAYGLICQFVPPFVNPMEQKAMAAIDAAAEGVSTTADNVRATATTYQEDDEADAALFRKTGEALAPTKTASPRMTASRPVTPAYQNTPAEPVSPTYQNAAELPVSPTYQNAAELPVSPTYQEAERQSAVKFQTSGE